MKLKTKLKFTIYALMLLPVFWYVATQDQYSSPPPRIQPLPNPAPSLPMLPKLLGQDYEKIKAVYGAASENSLQSANVRGAKGSKWYLPDNRKFLVWFDDQTKQAREVSFELAEGESLKKDLLLEMTYASLNDSRYIVRFSATGSDDANAHAITLHNNP